MNEPRWVGARICRIDAEDKVTGKLKFMSDLSFPGMLWGAVLRSAHPHALIKKIDTSRAEAMEGVVAVLTHRDVPGLNGFGIVIPDQPVLCSDKVRYMGDAVALVAAVSKERASEALRAIDVEYDPLPLVDDPENAMLESSPKVHAGGNIHHHIKVERGDVDAAFREAAVVVENTYHTPRQMHAFMETESGVAAMDEHGDITVWCGSQHPFRDQLQIARALGMNPRKIHVVSTPAGGAFGGKDEITVQIYLALLALRTGRPVKMVLSREESVVAGMKRHPMRIRMKTAAAADGTLLANEVRVVADTGAYASLGGPVVNLAIEHSCGPYRMPNVRLEGFCVYTNNGLAGAFRGFGANQVTFALETQVDMIAERLGIDKLEFRRKNVVRRGDVAALGHTMTASVGATATLEAASRCELWARREELKAKPSAPYKRRGVGLATELHGCGLGVGLPDYGAATIELLPDGRFAVGVSCPEIGQGNTTAFAQMAADSLGSSVADIMVVSGDSRHTLDSGTSTASRSVYTGGNAIRCAAARMRDQVADMAAEALGVPHDAIVFGRGGVEVRHHLAGDAVHPVERLSFREIARIAEGKGRRLKAEGDFIWPVADRGVEGYFGLPHLIYSYITQVALVEVNTLTGEVEVLRAVSIPDPGKAINPAGIEAQSEGGVVMGMGYALMEDTVIEQGITKTPNFSTYIIPTSADVPDIETIIVEEPEPSGPFGAKGIGEAVCVPITPAVTNAIHDATGIWVTHIPATPERVYMALKKQAGEEAAGVAGG
ncbi:MAG: xanthine dehydrogenase family protein molybdopterin-binding subunit [Clostridia bacterium]